MTRRLIAVTAALLATEGIAGSENKPNIIFFLADDLGYMDLAAYASHVKGCDRSDCYYETPNIDRLVDNLSLIHISEPTRPY